VPAGAVCVVLQIQIITPPLTPGCPKWMCDMVMSPSSPSNSSSQLMVWALSSMCALKVPTPGDDTAGTSWYDSSLVEK